MLKISDYKNILYNKNQEKYQIKCIEYFLKKDYIVYGNIEIYGGWLPICFKNSDERKFELQTDLDNWETLYNQKEIMLKMLEMKYEYDFKRK